jgi:two-component sensor histidine kinase
VNKAADQYKVVDAGAPVRAPDEGAQERGRAAFGERRGRRADPGRPSPGPRRPARQWSDSQQHLAVIWNDNGMRPDEIASRLGLGTQVVIQMLLAARR